MSRRYHLDSKIDALNQIDQLDGDLAHVSQSLDIPVRTLENWRESEADLRRDYRKRQGRHNDRLEFRPAHKNAGTQRSDPRPNDRAYLGKRIAQPTEYRPQHPAQPSP